MDNPGLYRLIGGNYHDSNLDSIQLYLERGGDPNYQLYSGVTVFIEAVCFPSLNIRVIRELINAGADVNISNHLGATPLLYAVRYRKGDVVDAVIQSGASVNARDFLGKTALHHAVCKRELEVPPRMFRLDPDTCIVKKLLKHESIDCNLVDSNGETPLMLAVKDNQLEIIKLLLENKANPNICNNFSETPLHAAFSHPENSTDFHLLRNGASIYSVDKNGQTPLDVLIENGLGVLRDEAVKGILLVVAFKYSITSDLKKKLKHIPHLLQDFNQYCKEVDHLRRDVIYGKFTMHDFLCNCYDETDSDLQEIHETIVERLVRNIYPGYWREFVYAIPKFSLCSILQRTASAKIRLENGRVKNLAYVLSIIEVSNLITKRLIDIDIFNLIRAFSSDDFC